MDLSLEDVYWDIIYSVINDAISCLHLKDRKLLVCMNR